MRNVSVLLAGAMLAASMPAMAATTTVDIDGLTNASLDGSNAVNVALRAGTYNVTFTQAAFTAFSRFASESGCDASGGNCQTGFENSARYIIDGTTFLFGDGAATGGIGPVSGGAYYDSAARSFANAGKYLTSFTLANDSTVGFYLYDDNLGDNRGGVSLALAGAVPEPSAWALFIIGFGAVGASLRSRRRVTATVHA